MLIQRRPRKGTRKGAPRKKKSKITASERRKSIVSDMQEREEFDSDTSGSSTSPTPRRRRAGSLKSHKKPELKTVEEESEEDVYDGDETEDYWFFVNRWLAKSEDDGALERELTPTDDKGRPLKGALAGKKGS